MLRDYDYENNNSVYNSDNTVEIKCKNYKVCEDTVIEWVCICEGNYLCTNCRTSFCTVEENGYLNFKNNEKCPVCNNIDECVKYPRCNHYVCIKCFKNNWYGDMMSDTEPQFPYPELKNEFHEYGRMYRKMLKKPIILLPLLLF